MTHAGSRLSLIVPVFRSADLALACLRSIVADPDARDVDLVVVDDASGDDTAQRLEDARIPGVRVLRRERNGGFARACMDGWRHRRTEREFVGVLNADTEVEPGWLSACLEQLDDDDGIACVVPSVTRYDDPERLDSAGQAYAVPGWGYRRGHGRPVADFPHPAEVFGPTGCAMIARSAVIASCGGLFREDFECYYEDTELSFRLHQVGARSVHVPNARVRHHVSATYNRIPRRRAYFVSRNSSILFWTAVPIRRWWSAIPQRIALTGLLLGKAIRDRCLVAFLRGRLEAWPMILRSRSLRTTRAPLSAGWLRELNRARRT